MRKKADRAEHARRSDIDQRYVFDARDRADGRSFPVMRFDDDRTGAFDIVRILYADGSRSAAAGEHRTRMQHLCAEKRKFLRFFVRYFAYRLGVGTDAGIGRHDAVDVFPRLNLFRLHRSSDDRRSQIASAPPERRNIAAFVFCDKTRHDRNALVFSGSVRMQMLRYRLPHFIEQFRRHKIAVAYDADIPRIVR